MSFTDDDVTNVWNKGKIRNGYDPKLWRLDACGALMSRDAYGDRKSQYGWEVDHISPGGSDKLENLRPLQWKNNVAKSDGKLKCVVKAVGSKNLPVS